MTLLHAHLVWQQSCEALAVGDHEQAQQLLELGLMSAPDHKSAAEVLLFIGSVHALYGPESAPQMQQALLEAARHDPEIQTHELFSALHAEAQSHLFVGQPLHFSGNPTSALARYHLHSALFFAGEFDVLEQFSVNANELPPHLHWRFLVQRGLALEAIDLESARGEEILNLYDSALALLPASELIDALPVHIRSLSIANIEASQNANPAQLEHRLQALEKAMEALQNSPTEDPMPDFVQQLIFDGQEIALMVRANLEMHRGNPERALQHLDELWRLLRQQGERPEMQQIVMKSEIFNHMGRHADVGNVFKEALRENLPQDERLYLQHHLAIWHIEQEQVIEAEELLQTLRSSPYPWQGEVLADLGKCRFQVGDFKEAERFCKEALKHPSQGAQCSGHLMLGQIYMEYCDHSGAEHMFRKTMDLAEPKSDYWVEAHQLLSENMAREGFPNPMAAHHMATVALAHTHPEAEWYDILLRHQQNAAALLTRTNNERILN